MQLPPLKWSAFEYVKRYRNNDWYWAVGIITIALCIIAVIVKNYLFAILIIMIMFAILMHNRREPQIINFEINEIGIRAGRKIYRFADLESFAIEDLDEERRLLLKSKKVFMPLIMIPLGEASADNVSTRISKKLKSEDLKTPVGHLVIDRLGF